MKKLIYLSLLSFVFACDSNKSGGDVIETFNANGTIKSSTPVKNGMRNGTEKNYDDQGRLISSIEYKDNRRHGIYEEYLPETQKRILRVEFKNDTQQGTFKQYYREGKLYRESFYENGRLEGPYTTYWPDSTKREVVYFEKGKRLIKSEDYDKKGNLTKKFPEIVIKRINQLRFANKYVLEFSLSEKKNETVFYTAKPDEKYLPTKLSDIALVEGKPVRVFFMIPGQVVNEDFMVVAKYKSESNNFIYLTKMVKVNVAH